MRSLLSYLLITFVCVANAEDSEAGKPPTKVRDAVKAFVDSIERFHGFSVDSIHYGSALGGQRTDMFTVDLEGPPKAETGPHRLGMRLWLEEDQENPHGFKLVDDAKTIDGTTLRSDLSTITYEAITKSLRADFLQKPLLREIGDEPFGGPDLPPLGLPIRYFALIQEPETHLQQWLYFGEIDGRIQLIAMVKKIAVE